MMESSRTGNDIQAAPSPHHPALWTGLYTGVLLIIVMLGALVAANRIPGFERYAIERNGACFSLFAIFMLVPVCRFLKHPLQMFASGMIGWVILVIGYNVAGMVFRNLFNALRHTPFEALIEGAVVYGVVSVGSWVGGMVLHARHHSITPRRRASNTTSHHL